MTASIAKMSIAVSFKSIAEGLSSDQRERETRLPENSSIAEFLSLMLSSQRLGEEALRKDCFSSICKKFVLRRDTLEERCFILGFSILCNQSLCDRLHYPLLNIGFFLRLSSLKQFQRPNLTKLDRYITLLTKEEWVELFDSMRIQMNEVYLKDCLGPVRPTAMQRLLSESSIEGLAFQTLLNEGDEEVHLRIKTKQDLEIWKALCDSSSSSEQNASQPCLPRHLLRHSIKQELFDIRKVLAKVKEIEISPELVDSLVPKLSDMEVIHRQKSCEELMHRLPVHSAKVIIGFSSYPGLGAYPSR
jgi:hypothetical protein